MSISSYIDTLSAIFHLFARIDKERERKEHTKNMSASLSLDGAQTKKLTSAFSHMFDVGLRRML